MEDILEVRKAGLRLTSSKAKANWEMSGGWAIDKEEEVVRVHDLLTTKANCVTFATKWERLTPTAVPVQVDHRHMSASARNSLK
jgi:hypothetical protein